MLIHPPRLIKKIYPSFIWSFPEETDSVFLTFDDGPRPEVTPWVLDQLDNFNAKATFFCIGKNVELFPDLYNEIIRRGHCVGNHSYSHIKGWHMDDTQYIRDVDTADELIHSNLYRPPYAKITIRQANLLSGRFYTIMWTILSRDYNRNLSGKQCAKNVIPHIYPGAIIVFHDSVKCAENLWYALPLVLEEIRRKGYNCKSILL